MVCSSTCQSLRAVQSVCVVYWPILPTPRGLGSAGRERARELTWDAAAQKLEGALIALLKLGGEADTARQTGVPEGEALHSG